jgi:hypothetical protein
MKTMSTKIDNEQIKEVNERNDRKNALRSIWMWVSAQYGGLNQTRCNFLVWYTS